MAKVMAKAKSADEIRIIMDKINKIISIHKPIIDDSLVDFYIKDLYNALPEKWGTYLCSCDSIELSNILDLNLQIEDMPDSLRSLRDEIRKLHINRMPSIDLISLTNNPSSNLVKSWQMCGEMRAKDSPFIQKLFKKVKFKKRHEIFVLAEVIHKSCLMTNTDCIIDIGSGLGHLARLLAFGYGLQVIAIDVNEEFTNRAIELDIDFAKYMTRSNSNVSFKLPQHINMRLSENDFNQTIDQLNLLKYGLVGLHPCGNLAVQLMRMFVECKDVSFINLCACCYMRLSINKQIASPSRIYGFPVSIYGQMQEIQITIQALEVACHGIEKTIDKLRSNNTNDFHTHAFRAMLQFIIADEYPQNSNWQIGNVKYIENMTFIEYCMKALKDRPEIILDHQRINSIEIQNKLLSWKNLISVSIIKLLFAPLIETYILYDRLLYILEEDDQNICDIMPIFDPKISPRNYVTIACKRTQI